MALLIIALVAAYAVAIKLTLRGIARGHDGMAIGGVAAMVLIALQLGGAMGHALG